MEALSDFIVLQEKSAPMSLCAICPRPGSCCSHFDLIDNGDELVTWASEGREAIDNLIKSYDLPFIADEIRATYKADDGSEYVTWWFSCPKVTAEGRCSIYDERPGVCRSFVPGSNGLCKPFYREAAA